MSSFGKIFRLTTFGESHSAAIGGMIEGIPSCFKLDEIYVQNMLNRRKPGQSTLTTKRNEADTVKILSGLENGITLGTPIGFIIPNQDVKKHDYSEFDKVPRPGHGDLTYLMKYDIKAESGGGRASARETACRVVAGAIAENYLGNKKGTYIISWVSSVGEIEIPKDFNNLLINNEEKIDKYQLDLMGSFAIYSIGSNNNEDIDSVYKNLYSKKLYDNKGQEILIFQEDLELNKILINKTVYKFEENVNIRCPHESTAVLMIELIKKTRNEKDSIGGTITCVCKKVPTGLGEPCFDKIEALLAHAMLSIPATKGFEIGSGFSGTKMKGSQHNDVYIKKNIKMEECEIASGICIKPETNRAGGIQAGISNGEDIYFRVAFKPVSTIGKQQKTVDLMGNECLLEEKGRHDPCILPRASPIVEAMAAIVIMDCFLQQSVLEFQKTALSKI